MLEKILVFFTILFLYGCNNESGVFEKMKSSEKLSNQQANLTVLAYMSLDTMFPNKIVRALAKAAGEGNLRKIDELVDLGVDVNSRGRVGVTPLFWAMKNIKGFTKLLELGADPNIILDERDGDGGSLFEWAISSNDSRFLIEMLKHGGNPNLVFGQFKHTLLFEAVTPEGKHNLDILVSFGANIDAQRSSGETPMVYAAGLGQFDVVYKLLKLGADHSISNKLGKDLVDMIEFREKTMDPNNELTNWMKKVIQFLRKDRTDTVLISK